MNEFRGRCPMLGATLVLAVAALAVTGLLNLVTTPPPPASPRGLRGAQLGVWCPVTRSVQRVRVDVYRRGRKEGLQVRDCDRWGAWPVGCDMACLEFLQRTALVPGSPDVHQALTVHSAN